ncbi:transcription factor bHLH113 [Quercus suber]|uniref:transcription factor bHLH113 n=1 Tax=Quercus suber TaxID=58331 RepID=UPI000CE22A18|nr:transcription factor bHLH113 [Quercus suber]POE75941.1 transcription factor [Quercus suber]
MAKNEGFVGDHLRLRGAPAAAATFSQLLLAEDDDDDDENNNGVAVAVGLDVDQTTSFNYTSSVFSSEKPPKMLCFGNYHQKHHQGDQLVYPSITENNITNTNTTTPQKSGVTCSDSSSASSGNNNNNSCVTLSVNTLSKPDKKRNGLGQESAQCGSTITTAVVATQRTSKRTKTANPTPAGQAKRKEKLGERITTLQQLVSPFGKTDTASVLHEAMGYIKFLQDQVQVLCSPYLQRLPSSSQHHLPKLESGENGGGEAARKDLRSIGLCLVPVDCTVHVANNNGADFWSPAAMGNNVCSPSTKHSEY